VKEGRTVVITVQLLLLVSALIVTILSGIGRAPLWVAVLLLCISALLTGVVPLR
jgi:hypothetical protein